MAGRRYRVVRSAGQDAPKYTMPLAAALEWGQDLFFGGKGSGISVPAGFDLDMALAELAWSVHRHQVLAHWAEYWAPIGPAPTCWAQRVFDHEPQIQKPKDPWMRDRWQDIELQVSLALDGAE